MKRGICHRWFNPGEGLLLKHFILFVKKKCTIDFSTKLLSFFSSTFKLGVIKFHFYTF